MTSGRPLNSLLDEILIQIGKVVPYDSACVFLIEDDMLQLAASQGLSDAGHFIGNPLPLDDDLIGRLLSSHQPLIIEDMQRHPLLRGWRGSEDDRTWMGVPLATSEASLGCMTLTSRSLRAFGPGEASASLAFATQAAMIVENTRLQQETASLREQNRLQQNQIRQLLDVITDGVLLLDGEKRIVEANGVGKAYLAQLTDVQVGQKLNQLGLEPIDVFIGTKTDSMNWHELAAVEPRGAFEVAAPPIGQPDKQDGWLLLIRNVTAERKREGYLRAQERLSTVGQLAAGIAHDFNNIMAIISLYTQLVMRTSNLRDLDEQRLSIIHHQAQQASDLIRQILDFSRQSVVERKPMDLLPFMRETGRALRQSLPDSIQLEMSFEDDEYFIRGDSGRLLQAFNNLVANSAEAMAEGGRLTFSLKNISLRSGEPFPLPDMASGDWICITVSDTGRGVPPDVLPRMFEPFYSTKPSGKGSGLGLAQVYGIVKLHDGYIDVDSQVDEGTTITIYLPAFVPAAHEAPVDRDEAVYMGSGETILIVEDDPSTREALAEYLSVLNYNVLTSANGREALEIYRDISDVRLVLTDMVMPVMDGATLFAELKRSSANVKMIIITGYPLDANIVNLLEQEAVRFINKPLRVEEVARTIKESLQ